MKKIILIGIIAIALIFAVAGIFLLPKNYTNSGNPGSSQSGKTQVQIIPGQNVAIKDYAFTPSQLIIKAGQSVTWTNNGQASHTITSNNGNELSSSVISPGQTYAHTFNTPGTYNYYCSIHPSMVGQIIVT